MSDIKLKAASGGGSISLKGPSSAGSDTDFLAANGNLTVTGTSTLTGNVTASGNLIANGKVGIGNDASYASVDADDLIIGTTSGSSNHGLTILSPTNKNAGIYFSDGDNPNGAHRGYFDYNHTTDALNIGTAGTQKVVINSAGSISVPSGQGIDFSATSDASGKTGELLDDYEEGTWTPADASGQSISYTDTAGNCTYTKIGRTVIANFGVTFLSTSNAHEAKIGGLPFTCINTTSSNAAVAVSEHTDDQSTTMIVIENQSYIVILHCHNGVDARTNAECSGKNYRGTVVYQTD